MLPAALTKSQMIKVHRVRTYRRSTLALERVKTPNRTAKVTLVVESATASILTAWTLCLLKMSVIRRLKLRFHRLSPNPLLHRDQIARRASPAKSAHLVCAKTKGVTTVMKALISKKAAMKKIIEATRQGRSAIVVIVRRRAMSQILSRKRKRS